MVHINFNAPFLQVVTKLLADTGFVEFSKPIDDGRMPDDEFQFNSEGWGS